MPTSLYRLIACGLAGLAAAANSQTSQLAADTAEKERLVAEKDRIVAEKDLVSAKADLERTRITSFGLPTFEGKTTLKDNAGKLEAMMLASDAIGGAVKLIKDDVPAGRYLVLAGDEGLDFSLAESMALEVDTVRQLLAHAMGVQTATPHDAAGGIAALSAIAGLLRSETEVSAIDLTTSLPNRLLAAAVARQVGGALPSQMIRASALDPNEPMNSLPRSWNALLSLAEQAAATRKAMGDKPADKAKAAALDRALARYKSLFDRATTANDKGIAPITNAIRLDRLSRYDPKILRVYAEHSGGTFVASKNLATHLGFDPMKVSGGVIVSYSVTDPTSGRVEEHGIISCRTALTSLRRVQAGKWNRMGTVNNERCQKVI